MDVEVIGDLTPPHSLVAEARERLAKLEPDYTRAREVGGEIFGDQPIVENA
jgi:hypothetical protein